MTVRVVQPDLEGLEPPQHRRADPPCPHGPDLHALQVIGPRYAVGDVPAPVDHPLVRRDVVAHQREDHHHHVLRDADAVREGHLRHGDAVLDGRVDVDVVGADPRRHRQLELGRLCDPFRGQVGGPEGLRDHDLGLRKLAIQHRVGALLVGGDDQVVPTSLDELAQPELAGHAAQQLPGREVDVLGRRCVLAAVVMLDRGHGVARIGRRITADGVVVENANDVRHGGPFVGLAWQGS